jgi:lipoate-protein ligase A
MKRCEYKVPGGKLICAKAETQDNKITFLQFTGDFFLQPETDLEDLERHLIGTSTDPKEITQKIVDFLNKRKTIIAGAKPEDFAHVLNTALK